MRKVMNIFFMDSTHYKNYKMKNKNNHKKYHLLVFNYILRPQRKINKKY